MPMVLLASVILAHLLQSISPGIGLTANSLLIGIIGAACVGITCGAEGLIKKETMKWMSIAGMVMNALLGFASFVIMQAL